MSSADHTAYLVLRPDGVFRAVCACNWTSDRGHSTAPDRDLALVLAERDAERHEHRPTPRHRRARRKA